MSAESSHLVWRKSSRSAGSNCVELAINATESSAVRDSKQGEHGPVLRFPAAAVTRFVKGIRA